MPLPTSDHFTLQEIAAGVYAAIAADEGGAFANAGIIDLGDRTIQFDSFMSPQASRDLREAAIHLTGAAPSLIVISHAHFDHYQGAMIYPPDIPILSTAINREEMLAAKARSEAQDRSQTIAQITAFADQLRQRLAAATDPHEQYDLRFQVGYLSALLAVASEVTTPTINATFDGSITLHGRQRSATVFTVGGGHSNSDVLLELPEDRILFTGDILSVKCHPSLAAGHLTAWQQMVANLQRPVPYQYVPGHGGIGSSEDVEAMEEYLATLITQMQDLIKGGGTAEEVKQIAVPAVAQDWKFQTWLFAGNLQKLYQEYGGQFAGG